MRHGPAEDHARSGRDFDRKLTASGRARTELVAHELGQREEQPKRVVSSPLARTLETAEIVIATLRLGIAPESRDELARDGARRVMLVGHEPDVSRITSTLLPTWSQGFDKAMVVSLKIDRETLAGHSKDDGAAELRFVIEPKRLGN